MSQSQKNLDELFEDCKIVLNTPGATWNDFTVLLQGLNDEKKKQLKQRLAVWDAQKVRALYEKSQTVGSDQTIRSQVLLKKGARIGAVFEGIAWHGTVIAINNDGSFTIQWHKPDRAKEGAVPPLTLKVAELRVVRQA